jgi:hypothetical protein
MSKPRKPRAVPPREFTYLAATGVLLIQQGKKATGYVLRKKAIPVAGVLNFRVDKLDEFREAGAPGGYDVAIGTAGDACSCTGFANWKPKSEDDRRHCRHTEAIRRLIDDGSIEGHAIPSPE